MFYFAAVRNCSGPWQMGSGVTPCVTVRGQSVSLPLDFFLSIFFSVFIEVLSSFFFFFLFHSLVEVLPSLKRAVGSSLPLWLGSLVPCRGWHADALCSSLGVTLLRGVRG